MHVAVGLLLALASACAIERLPPEPGWRPDVVYTYSVETRTLAGLEPPPSQLNGVLTRATLRLQVDHGDSHQLNARVEEAQFSRLHARLAGPWDAPVPPEDLRWRELPLRFPVFALRLRDGQIKEFMVEKDAPLRDINYLRGVASTLQLSVGALFQKRISNVTPAFYPVLEESPVGKCQTRYDVSALPTYLVQSTPSLAPAADLKKNRFLDIVKTINFDHCSHPMPLEWMTGGSEKTYKRGPVTRSALTRAIVAGNLTSFELQSAVASSRMSTGTLLRDTGRESAAWGRVNVTLRSVDEELDANVTQPKIRVAMSLVFNGAYSVPTDESPRSPLVKTQKHTQNGEIPDADADTLRSFSRDEHPDLEKLKLRGDSKIQRSAPRSILGDCRYDQTPPINPDTSSRPCERSGYSRILDEILEIAEKYDATKGKLRSRSASILRRKIPQNNTDDAHQQFTHHTHENKTLEPSKSRDSNDFRGEDCQNNLDSANHKSSQLPRNNLPLYSHCRDPRELASVPRALYQYAFEFLNKNKPVYARSNRVTNWDDFIKLVNSMKDELTGGSQPSQPRSRSGEEDEEDDDRYVGPEGIHPRPTSADEQRFHDILDFETMVALAIDPAFAGAQQICPEQDILDMAREIAEDMQEPGELVQRQTLQRFGELTRLVRSCRHEALTSIGAALQPAWDPIELSAWKAFRDATAAAGTGSSLIALRHWLRNGVVSGLVARQLVATLRGAARHPSVDYINYFWDFITGDQQIKRMEGVNTTALLTLASLVYDAQTHKMNVFHIVAHFVQQLRIAAQKQDHLRMQVLIRAVGLTGNHLGAMAFARFLNGKVPGTTIFLRTEMVFAMQRMAILQPDWARKVLYNLFENDAEAYEVRVAAVYILMCAQPSLARLQRMAATAHLDPNEHLSAAVRTALQAAAGLKDPRKRRLAQDARAVLASLTHRTQSLHYSRSYLKDHFVYGDKGMGYTMAFNYIGSQDESIPKMLYFGLTAYMGGLKLGLTEYAAAVSSVSKLISTWNEQEEKKEFRVPSDMLSSAIPVNLGSRSDEPLEGHIMFPLAGGSQFFNFDKTSMYHSVYKIMLGALAYLGEVLHISKLYYGPRYSYAAPDITGHMTFFNFDEISLVRTIGRTGEILEPNSTIWSDFRENDDLLSGLNFDMNLVYANTMTSRLGFVCLFDEKPRRFVAAYDQEYQYHIPINSDVGILSGEKEVYHYVLTATPLSNKKQTLMHFSSTPFTALESPDAQGPGAEREALVISARDQRESIKDFGLNGGFRFNVTSEAQFFDMVQSKIEHRGYDFWSFFFLPIVYVNTENVEASLTFDPQKAQLKSVVMHLRYKADSGDEPLDLAIAALKSPRDVFKQFVYRKQKLDMGMFIYGNKKFAAHVFRTDYKIDFSGRNETLGLHYTYEESNNAEGKKSAAGKKYDREVHLRINSKWGVAPRWNFDEALAANATSSVSVKLLYITPDSNRMTVDAKCVLRRTPKRVQYLTSDRTAILCREQMDRGDLYLPACINVTLRAGYLDNYHCEADFDRLDPGFMNLTANMYLAARRKFMSQVQEDFLYRGETDHATADVQFKDGFHAVSVALRTPKLAADFENIRMTRFVRPLVVVHPQYNHGKRVAQYVLVYQNEPKCVLDKNSVNTFDNRTYNVKLGPCWHNMTILRMQDGSGLNMTIQARDVAENRIFAVILPSGARLELVDGGRSDAERSESSASVILNGNLLTISQDVPVSLDVENNAHHDIVEISLVTGNLFLLNLKNHQVRILFDGIRIMVYVPNKFRAHALGLCGTFTGEPLNDFKDPDGFYQRDPRFFAASYADVRQDCEGHAKDDNALSKKAPRFKEEILLFDVFGIYHVNSRSKPSRHSCNSMYVDVVHNGTSYCFSQQTLPKCSGLCKPSEYETITVKYHCVSGGSARFWKSLIDRGSKPDFSRKATSNVLEKKVAKTCKPRKWNQ